MTYSDEMEQLRLLLNHSRQELDVPAIGASIVEGSAQHMHHVVGVRRRGSLDQVLLSDKWHIGSCTKSVTAALWARLVDMGCAGWDYQLSDIFEDLSPVHVEWKNVSIRDALQCRAGFRRNFSRDVFRSSWKDGRPLPEQRSDVVERALQQPPVSLGKFVYSNLSYVVVGAAIDRMMGFSFEDALKRYVLDPLDIRTAGFGAPEDNFGHRPRIYLDVLGLGLLKGRPTDSSNVKRSDNPPVLSSAGTLHLSLEDWNSLIRIFLVDNDTKLLDKESLEKIFEPPVPFSPMVLGWMQWLGSKRLSFVMQGSNTLWSATAAMSKDRRRCALIVCNDGRSRVLDDCIPLAVKLLAL